VAESLEQRSKDDECLVQEFISEKDLHLELRVLMADKLKDSNSLLLQGLRKFEVFLFKNFLLPGELQKSLK
jgi:hypothetical protein